MGNLIITKGFKLLICSFFLLFVFRLPALAQSADRFKLSEFIARNDSITKLRAAEKLYLHFDKSQYVPGDTIRFKGYLFDASTLFLSTRSGILHVDILNDSNRMVTQYLTPVYNGVTWGNLVLTENNFTSGNYKIRAYTNWMRNFGDEAFYYKDIQVGDLIANSWLVQIDKNELERNHPGDSIQLHLTNLYKKPIADSLIRIRMVDGSKSLFKQNIQADKNGTLDLNVAAMGKARHPAIIIEDQNKHHHMVVPLPINRSDDVDLQFLPEGGSLIAGLYTRVGFKAIGVDGIGRDVSGVITDQNGVTVVSFKSLYKGIGSFEMLPLANEIYTASITLSDGSVKKFSFPAVKANGTLLRVSIHAESDSVQITLASTKDFESASKKCYFLVKVRGLVCYAAIVDFGQSTEVKKLIAKNLFPTGITHFILLTQQGQPLNERLVYINHHDDLKIDARGDRPAYFVKDSVALHIQVADNSEKPTVADLSIAVTDDALVNAAGAADDNIITRLLLTSDLKGYVEGPGYYFNGQTSAQLALDNLLLTQGWIDYDPTKLPFPFNAEAQYAVDGKVTTILGNPVKKTHVMLFSRLPSLLLDTITDDQGRFKFSNFPMVDKPVFLLKAVNPKGESSNVKISMTEPEPPVINAAKMAEKTPWYVNCDSIFLQSLNNAIILKKQSEYLPATGHLLKEVIIKGKKTVNGSGNSNEPGNADQVIDENEMEQAGKITWLQLLERKIKGFVEGSVLISLHGPGFTPPPFQCYFIKDKMSIIVIDGELLPASSLSEARSYLKLHSAEDIRKVEVFYSGRNIDKYEDRFGYPPDQWPQFCFIEITTREGGGPVIHNTPGMYLYKPLALSWPKSFYKPRYVAKDTSNRADLRSTIDWEPNVLTDAKGIATIWFYAADKPSTYTITIEGLDFNGNLAFKQQKIIINPKLSVEKSK